MKEQDLQSLVNLYTTDPEAFKTRVIDIVLSTSNRYQFLYNDFPEQFKGINSKIANDQTITLEDVQSMLQRIANVQFKITIKEESLNKPEEFNNQNNNKMKNQDLKNKANNAGVKVSNAIFGALHFTFQSLADITLESEATVKNKLTGQSKRDIKKERTQNTIGTQIKCIESSLKVQQACRDAIKQLGSLSETKSTTTITQLQPDVVSSETTQMS